MAEGDQVTEMVADSTSLKVPVTSASAITVNGVKPRVYYQCDQCPYLSENRFALIRHYRTHTGEKPFKCKHCPSAFAQAYDLKRHSMAIHDQSKPHKCPKCEFECLRKANLVAHIRRAHSDGKPFKCSYGKCSYSTTTKKYLQVHMAIHANKERYQCSKCEYKCPHQWILTRHMRKHEREEQRAAEQAAWEAQQTKVEPESQVTVVQGQVQPAQAQVQMNSAQKVPVLIAKGFPPSQRPPIQKLFITPSSAQQIATIARTVVTSAIPVVGANWAPKTVSITIPVQSTSTIPVQSGNTISIQPGSTLQVQSPGTSQSQPPTVNLTTSQGNLTTSPKSPRSSSRGNAGKRRNRDDDEMSTSSAGRHSVPGSLIDKPFQCDMCGFAFTHNWLLQRHIKTHQYSGKNKQQLLARSLLRAARNQLERPRPFKCEECGFAFIQNWLLQRHLRSHAARRMKQQEQGTYFAGKMITQVQHQPQQLIQGQTFAPQTITVQQNTFKQEISDSEEDSEDDDVYSDEDDSLSPIPASKLQEYQCNFCPFQANNGLSLANHLRIHSDKTFQCNVCEFSTRNRKDYVTHVQEHANKKHHCSFCSLTFESGIGLSNHIRGHMGENKYRCDHCPFSTNQRRVLERHVKRSHTRKPLQPTMIIKPNLAPISQPQESLHADLGPSDIGQEVTVGLDGEEELEYESVIFECRYCGRQFDIQEEWVRHTQRHMW
ncbi:zinc finger protein 2-like isoform X1 [Branchiostoma floridae]|uniref:Zinc finger protein 2-like isoform X1 n=1 Tax=Branchiostoma floridae TaxID=7739 RepID=A0A9J7N0N2_BRAFL|nr:zinc finger protein 2-like isoform X1 [Branchiostoma floridae]XP_035685517.1 zinc finger protein 2-like isoform X1 [Branchiostoma floridae]